MHVLVTGATGYVGGRLVPRLLEAGHRVRVLVRDSSRLEGRPWVGQVEVVRGSLEDPTALRQALSGVEAAYYLVHAMLSEEDFPQAEER
nr:NAD(P)H-binding protein [Thermus caliditerrae]